jgi:ABC-type Fe3+-hydroxamate transport system substrate-binding protein
MWQGDVAVARETLYLLGEESHIRTLGALVGAADRADRLASELAATVGFARKRAAQLRMKPKVSSAVAFSAAPPGLHHSRR